jgi:hypothetical protein
MEMTTLRSAKDKYLGVRFTLAAPARAPFHVEATDGGRIRVALGTVPTLWARVERWNDGVWWLREDDREPIVPPIRAEIVRAAPATDREAWEMYWTRVFLDALRESPRSPLDRGVWELARAVDERSEHGTSGACSVEGIAEALEECSHGLEVWSGAAVDGDGGMLARRRPSPEDDGRVKMWRKRARDGSLPPVLLLFVTGLNMHLVIDGHDRLHAALLERTSPAMLTLLPMAARARPISSPVRDAVTEEYVRRIDEPSLSLRAATELGGLLSNVHRVPVTHELRTRASPVPGGCAAWDREVAAALDRLAPSADRAKFERA